MCSMLEITYFITQLSRLYNVLQRQELGRMMSFLRSPAPVYPQDTAPNSSKFVMYIAETLGPFCPPGSSSYVPIPVSSHVSHFFYSYFLSIYLYNFQCINFNSFTFLQKFSYIFLLWTISCVITPLNFSGTQRHT